MRKQSLIVTLSVLAVSTLALTAWQQAPQGTAPGAKPRPQDTEVWEPVPKVVVPPPTFGAPPPDAIVLFDGTNLDQWQSANKERSAARWVVAEGVMTVDKASGNIETKRSFTNYQLHLEYRVPAGTTGSGQSRGNSGLFLASTGPLRSSPRGSGIRGAADSR